jgi:hypothetical protein
MVLKLFLPQRAQPAIGIADSDERPAETEKRQRAQHAAERRHVGEEDLGDDEADARERGPAQPVVVPGEAGREPGQGEREPRRGIGVPLGLPGFAQGFGLGCTFVPLNLLALSGLPPHMLAQGTAIRALMRMLGGSIGIAVLETQLTQNTQIVHSVLSEHLRPDNPLAHAPYLTAPFSLTTPIGIAALNQEVTRQAAMIAYIDDFLLMLFVILALLPLLLFVRAPRSRPVPAAADD